MRTVALLAYDGAQVLDLMGPAEVFYAASELAGGGAYRVHIVSPDGRDTVSASGLRIGVTSSLADLGDPIDTFLIPGTPHWARLMRDEPLLAVLHGGAARARRVAAVCAGAFLVGAVGLLEGRRATTHWMFLDDLAERFPTTTVERGPIFVGDGHVFTCAGVTAGIDLALAMVEADNGPDLTRQVAQFLVVFMQRPGRQAQFSVRMQAQPPARSPLRTILDAVVTDPAADHRLSVLSERAGFSERHLARVFLREIGMTPARYVEQVRVEAARALLETSDAPLDVIARQAGLSSTEALRRSFTREVGTTPHAYRQRFRTTGVATTSAG
ncbi:GlxA family transcriptional regulator [Pseudonocardia xinjiangensis]|uniref:GlxA family transcriptional regulator n=1 Tax=Pseudonocardia xinjiangensis TaxID=75289 RepID=UPI003D8E9429